MKKPRKIVGCEYCKKEWEIPEHCFQKFCSKLCANRAHSELSRLRANSNKNPWRHKTWNKGLRYELPHKQGENSKIWKGGRNSLNCQIRYSGKYKTWVKEVFKRDNWTCQECKNIGGHLCPHHIIPLRRLIIDNNLQTLNEALQCKILWDISNGLTLCHECHKKTDSYGNNQC